MSVEKNSVNRRDSRYVSGGTTEIGQSRLEWWERYNILAAPGDRTYQVERKFAGRLDLISALFLGESSHWWVIAQYNAILDPFEEVREGNIIYIPSQERVASILGGKTGGVPSTREVPTSILPIV